MLSVYLGLFLLSAGALLFEIALSRIFSISQWYHFAFMAVGLALLGGGASGSFLQLWQERLRKLERYLFLGGVLFAISAVGGYLACNWLPFDSFRLGWDRVQFAYLGGYYLALTVPFFVGGGTFGLALALRPAQAGRLYFANLLGGGVGALVSVAVLSVARVEVAVVWAALLGWGAAVAFHWGARSRRPWVEAVLALLLMALLVCVIRPWPFMAIRLSPYKALSQLRRAYDARLEGTWWNALSRVDVVRSGTIHSLPGLSLSYSGAIPEQKGLLADGDNLYPITQATPEEAKFLDSLPVALAYHLAPRGRVLVLRPGGGLAAMAGLRYGAEEVVAVEANPLVAELLRGAYLEDSRGLYAQPRLTLAIEDERGFLGRDLSRYSLVHLALSDNYRAVTWGAYSLREDSSIPWRPWLRPFGIWRGMGI